VRVGAPHEAEHVVVGIGDGGGGGGEPSPLVLKRVEGHGHAGVSGGGHVPKHLSPSLNNRDKGVRKENWEGGRNPCQATPISKHPTLKSALARDGRV